MLTNAPMDIIDEIRTAVKRCTNLCTNKILMTIDPIANFDMIHQLVPCISNYSYLFDKDSENIEQQIDSLRQMAKAINKYIDGNFIGNDLNSLSLFNSFLIRANSICIWEKLK